jgi:hypothetical protein
MAALAKDLVLLVINHDVTWKAAEKMIKLINAHLLGKTLHENIPATAYQLKKATGSNPGHSRLLHVCRVCDFVFDTGQALCTTCGTPPRTRSNHQLLINDIGIRVTQMFANPAISKVPKYIIFLTLCIYHISHTVHISHKQMYTRRCSTPGLAGKGTVMCGMARSCVTSLQVVALMHVDIGVATPKDA